MADRPEAGSGSPVWDHRALRDLVAEVQRVLAEMRSADCLSGAAERRAVRQVDRLDAALAAHFRLEEGRAGSFAELLAKAPERTRELDALRAEHGPMADRMRAIAGRAHRAGTSVAAWGRVADDLDALLARIRCHELAEDRFVSDVLLTDRGGG